MKEVIQFHDPALIRAMHVWVEKNFARLAMAEGLFDDKRAEISRN